MAKAPHILVVEACFHEDIADERFRSAERVLLDASFDRVALKREREA